MGRKKDGRTKTEDEGTTERKQEREQERGKEREQERKQDREKERKNEVEEEGKKERKGGRKEEIRGRKKTGRQTDRRTDRKKKREKDGERKKLINENWATSLYIAPSGNAPEGRNQSAVSQNSARTAAGATVRRTRATSSGLVLLGGAVLLNSQWSPMLAGLPPCGVAN